MIPAGTEFRAPDGTLLATAARDIDLDANVTVEDIRLPDGSTPHPHDEIPPALLRAFEQTFALDMLQPKEIHHA